jgi:hypothetical protein
MAKPAARTSDQVLMRLAMGVILVFALWLLLGWIVGFIFTLVRAALLLVLLGIVGWFVLIGPPGSDD